MSPTPKVAGKSPSKLISENKFIVSISIRYSGFREEKRMIL